MQNQITQGSIAKQLMNFFIPIWIGTFFQYFYNTADAIIIGNLVGKEALAAVGGSTGNIINLLLNFFVGISSGATVIISQYYGAHDAENTSKSIHTAAALTLFVSATLTIMGTLFAPTMLDLIGTPDEILPYATLYLRIYFGGITTSVIYNFGSSMLRAMGDSRRPLYFLIICSFCNIALDLLFIAGFHWGVAGAALGTIISQGVSAYLVVKVMCNNPEFCRLYLRKIRFHKEMLKRIIHIGLPAGVQSLLATGSNFIIQSNINAFGTNTTAAWTVYSKLDAFFWMSINALGVSITTFVGQNFGAKEYDRVKKSVYVCLAMAFALTAFQTVTIIFFSTTLLHLFTQDTTVIDIAQSIVYHVMPFYFCFVPASILPGALRGVGNVMVPAFVSLFGICLSRIAWVIFIVPLHNELLFVLNCYPLTWAGTSMIYVIYCLTSKWLPKAIAKREA